MKALVISLIIALTASANTVFSSNNSQFAYNSEMSGERVESTTVFKVEQQKYLHRHLKYNFTYDAQGRVSQKETLKWNEAIQSFEKQYCLNFSYSDQATSIEYAAWNGKEDAYSNIKEKSVYQMNESTLNYQSYEWNKRENNWNLVAEHTTLHCNDALLANK